MAKLQANMKLPNSGFGACIDSNNATLDAKLPGKLVISAERKFYEGSYEITPKVTPQAMDTKGKIMRENVTVNEIPVFRTSNDSGGITVYIAKEI